MRVLVLRFAPLMPAVAGAPTAAWVALAIAARPGAPGGWLRARTGR